MRAKVLLLGLEQPLAEELAQAIRRDRHDIHIAPFENPHASARRVAESSSDIVFCSDELERLIPLLAALREQGCPTPVVVASRLPDASRWLDAIEAGACDYCGAPFESRLVQHVFDNALTYPRDLAIAS